MQTQALRKALSKPATSVQLCLLGLIAGSIAALVIIIFRLCLEFLHTQLLGGVGNYTALLDWQLFLLPIIAILIVLCIAKLTGFKHYRLGIPFVIHRFKMHYGHIPLATSINQFFGGILALASGFVVGKEGPTVHLAAAASHYVGRWCKLPFNSLRILAGCGIAAGIAAAFNTPFAAVIFVMEVVVRQYKVHIFVPIMLAAASGSVLTRLVFGDDKQLSFLSFYNMDYWHLPILILFGVFLGILGSMFNRQLMFTMRLFRPMNMATRLLIAGVITGTFGYFMPEAMVAEFVNIRIFIDSSPALQLTLLLFATKFVLAIIAISLGVPGGIIGAVMVIGMLAGILFLQSLFSVSALFIDTSLIDGQGELINNYALLGLAGLLATVLHAPLAALSAAMELSSAQQVILPALVTIVSAYVTAKQLCNNSSIFIQQLDYQGLSYTTTLIRDELQNTGVMAIMREDFTAFRKGKDADMYDYLRDKPDSIVINYFSEKDDTGQRVTKWQLAGLKISLQESAQAINVTELDSVTEQQTLAEVYELLYKKRHGGVVVLASQSNEIISEIGADGEEIDSDIDYQRPILRGIITWNMLHTYLLRQQH